MFRIILLLCVVAAVVIGVVIARTLPSPDQEAIRYRQALMTVIDGTARPLLAIRRGEAVYDPALVAERAGELPVLTGMVGDAFARDTSTARKVPSAALAAIWSRHAEFLASVARLHADAGALESAAQSGDQPHIALAITALGEECERCHRAFRAR